MALFGCKITKRIVIEDGEVVLLDYSQANRVGLINNLLKLRDADILWRAEHPSSGDRYVNVNLERGKLIAWSWGGYMVELDHTNGRILRQVFTK